MRPTCSLLPTRAALLLLLAFSAPAAAADESIAARLAAALAPLEPLARTGLLYDRVLPLARLDRWDGSPAAPVVDAAAFRQGVDELRRAAIGVSPLPSPEALNAAAGAAARRGVVPLGLVDRAFERLRPEAVERGDLRITGDRLEPAGAAEAVLSRHRAFAVAPLVASTRRGAEVAFVLDRERIFADGPWRSLAIDFGDGRGFRAVRAGEPIRVRYDASGPRTLTARLVREDGSSAVSQSSFEVIALVAPSPHDTLHVTATMPWQGQVASGDAYVYLAPGRTAIANPAIVVEGFDFNNEQNWDELYEQLNQQSLIEQMRADGFDVVVLNFTDATDAIQRNAFLVIELLQQVQAVIAPDASIAMVGASMGGLCTRFALAWMETHALPHRVRTWISFDAPHGGANIPLGLQYWIDFFAGQSADAATFRAILQRPAARQMLIYHWQTPPVAGSQGDPEKAALAADFAAVGGYPTQPRLVAVANGSGNGIGHGYDGGTRIIGWEYNSFLVAVRGNVWSVPDMTSHIIFEGHMRIAFSTTNRNVSITETRPWDGAPGGSRATLEELAAVQAPYGDIVAFFSSHDFIPTVSALHVPTGEPFFPISGTPGLLALTPFDAIHYPPGNEEHVFVSPATAAFVKQQIEQGTVSVPRAGAATSTLDLAASPNPARGGVTFAFDLPEGAPAALRVFAVDGREVARLAPASGSAGRLRWTAADREGSPLPAGVYFARLEAGAKSVTRRFAIVR